MFFLKQKIDWLILLFISGTLKCEAVVADVLDKGSGLVLLVDSKSLSIITILLLDLQVLCL